VDTVRTWRARFAAEGLAGVMDRPRSGRPSRFTPIQVAQVKSLACQPPTDAGAPLARWSCPELAREAIVHGMVEAVSASTVRRWPAIRETSVLDRGQRLLTARPSSYRPPRHTVPERGHDPHTHPRLVTEPSGDLFLRPASTRRCWRSSSASALSRARSVGSPRTRAAAASPATWATRASGPRERRRARRHPGVVGRCGRSLSRPRVRPGVRAELGCRSVMTVWCAGRSGSRFILTGEPAVGEAAVRTRCRRVGAHVQLNVLESLDADE
jgi:Homeodomain-like domain